MRLERCWTLLAVLLVCLVAAADDGSSIARPGAGATTPAENGARDVPCSPVATAWPTTDQPYTLQAPQLAVAITDIRPKDGMVFLDGRFAGRARYFNGTRGFLYLEPGTYRLELRLDGYRTDAFSIEARPSCLFEIRHRMKRSHSPAAEGPPPAVGKGEPERWVWAPIEGAPAVAPIPGRQGGPDVSLRPDLGFAPPAAPEAAPARGSLRLHVKPPTAEVYLDGSFLATGRELDLMVAPLALPAGQHVLEVRAPGFASRTEEVSTTEGEVVELEIVLQGGPS